MPYETFNDLNAAAMALYREQRYSEVLDLLTREGGAFPDDMQQVLYLRACMAVRVGQPIEGLRLIAEVLDRGGWYGEELLRRTPSWVGLQGQPAFEALAARHMARAAEAMAGARPLRVARVPEGDAPPGGYPLILSLHGNGQRLRRRWLFSIRRIAFDPRRDAKGREELRKRSTKDTKGHKDFVREGREGPRKGFIR